jgi:hypothetical protein
MILVGSQEAALVLLLAVAVLDPEELALDAPPHPQPHPPGIEPVCDPELEPPHPHPQPFVPLIPPLVPDDCSGVTICDGCSAY